MYFVGPSPIALEDHPVPQGWLPPVTAAIVEHFDLFHRMTVGLTRPWRNAIGNTTRNGDCRIAPHTKLWSAIVTSEARIMGG